MVGLIGLDIYLRLRGQMMACYDRTQRTGSSGQPSWSSGVFAPCKGKGVVHFVLRLCSCCVEPIGPAVFSGSFIFQVYVCPSQHCDLLLSAPAVIDLMNPTLIHTLTWGGTWGALACTNHFSQLHLQLLRDLIDLELL